MKKKPKGPSPDQAPLLRDENPLLDLSTVPNDADDMSDEGKPKTDHDATGSRGMSPSKP